METRIVLTEGKQKELIKLVKLKFGFGWKEFAEKLNCGQHYLSYELRNEKRTLSEKMYKELCFLSGRNFNKFIKTRLKGNWGQIKGGRNVKKRQNLFQTKKPKILCNKSKKLAEVIGIMLGDGSLYILPKKGIYQVHVAGNSKDEENYMLNYVKPLFEDVFKINMNIKRTKTGIYVWKQSKDLVFTLNKFGLPIGNKKMNNAHIPSWIMRNKEYLRLCLRGVFDTDGCVYPKNKTNLYPTIWISSAIPTLRQSLTLACNKLGFNLSKWKRSRNDAYIGRRSEVFKFYKEVKFSNQKHLLRWDRFNKLLSSSPVNSS